MPTNLVSTGVMIAGVVVFVLIVVPMIVASFLRNVEAGTIRLVSWLSGGTIIYRGPGKSKEIPLLTTGGTIDKIYFDALSDYRVGESVVAQLLEIGRVRRPFRVEQPLGQVGRGLFSSSSREILG